jgi:hypothetical protein
LLEGLPVRTQAGQTALVTLIGSEQEAEADPQRLIDYLQKVAHERNLDFFCNHDGWERIDFSRVPLRFDEVSAPAPVNIISCHVPWNMPETVPGRSQNKEGHYHEDKSS